MPGAPVGRAGRHSPFMTSIHASMNPSSLPPRTRPSARRLWLWGLLATPLLLLILLGAGVASCFRLGADARAVRNALIKASGVEWRPQIVLNAGRLTLGAVRAGLSCVRLDPAARAALQSVHAAEVGVYQLPAGKPPPNRAAMLASADSAMAARGWERVVGVIDGRDLVAVYFPKEASVQRLKCCVLVFDGKEMVLVSAQGNPLPLATYALAQPGFGAQRGWLAQR
jgi:hypothetical protein